MGDDSLYHPRQGLYLMGQPEEGLRGNYLWRGETQRGEPGIGEQPSVSVGSQGRLSPICESRMGGRGCGRNLRHGHGDWGGWNCFLGHPTREEIRDAILRHGPSPPSSAKMLGSSHNVG
ncbi:hypothetical protein GW17_00050895 [Ensete ventricosum]|nr:hypothetical protein GW17_00050895 [Ensete ventricosum]